MKLQQSLIALAAGALLTTGAHATISYGASADAQPYVGVKVGQIDADHINGKLTGYGVYGGYNFDQNFGVEGEFIGSSDKDFTVGTQAREGNVKTYGAYGTYRYNFNNTPFYAKGKLGVAKTDVKVTSKDGSYSHKDDQVGVAGGVGLGYKHSNFGVEAGYNYLSSDANMLSLGASFAF